MLALVSYILLAAVAQRIGIQRTAENQITMNPQAQEQMAKATAEQRGKAYQFWTGFADVMFIAGPASRRKMLSTHVREYYRQPFPGPIFSSRRILCG